MKLELGPIPPRPPFHSGEAIYDNTVHVLDEAVEETLVHDQQMFAVHTAKGYQGSVYCYIDSNGVLRWCEEVWLGLHVDNRFRATDLDKLLAHVIDIYGEA